MRARSPSAVLVCLVLACSPAAAMAGTDPLDGALGRYRAIAAQGGWPALPPGATLEPGDRDAAVPVLRARLVATGDCATTSPADPARYDDMLARAVRAFQRRHGIRSDGVVGAATREALNVSVGERTGQLERARSRAAAPAPRGRWIRVNVPAYTLEVLDGSRVALAMPVVVGRPDRPTPLFEKTLSAIVFNPAWTVPSDLAFHDLLPKIIADPGYLARRGIDVYESWEPGAARLDASRIDWKHLGARIESLTLRQRPGPGNGLGRMMFRMDGEQEIFLHDTPAHEIFREDRRAFSSGCIRVADAEGLARAVLDPETARRLGSLLARRDTFTVTLARPVPVRTVYETAWVDARGTVSFRDDVYAGQPAALARPPRKPPAAPVSVRAPRWLAQTSPDPLLVESAR